MKKYQKEEFSTREIGKICGVTHHTILKWLKKFKIEKKRRGAYKSGIDYKYVYIMGNVHKSLKRLCLDKNKKMSIYACEIIARELIREGYNPYRSK